MKGKLAYVSKIKPIASVAAGEIYIQFKKHLKKTDKSRHFCVGQCVQDSVAFG
uniref:Uncharacterized protein n=1 Tax=Medicago truncatula TaxID=3880 RepID=A2Q2Y9_MEDTR|nr:hypothetical protein MtrDRAFT_AC153128g7v2 [Medicago truncatula]